MPNSGSGISMPRRQRGQVFSIDLIIAMSLVILGVGLLFNAANLRAFEAKESFLTKDMQEKAEAAVIALANGKYTTCSFESTPLAYSVDLNKTNIYKNSAPGALKKYMGLQDYNVNLAVGGNQILDDATDGKDVVAIDINVMLCLQSSAPTYANLATLMAKGNPGDPSRQTLSLKVSR